MLTDASTISVCKSHWPRLEIERCEIKNDTPSEKRETNYSISPCPWVACRESHKTVCRNWQPRTKSWPSRKENPNCSYAQSRNQTSSLSKKTRTIIEIMKKLHISPLLEDCLPIWKGKLDGHCKVQSMESPVLKNFPFYVCFLQRRFHSMLKR